MIASSPIAVVVFDFDGTLVDSNAIKRDVFYEIAAGHPGGEGAVDAALAAPGVATRYEVCAMIAAAVCPGKPFDADALATRLVDSYGAVTGERVSTCPEIPGAASMLAAMSRRGCVLALNSATPATALADIVERRNWRHWFAHIAGSPVGKADNLRMIARENGVAMDGVLMVGDREADRVAAIEAGCRFLGLLRPDSDFCAPLPPHVANLDELVAAVDSMTIALPVRAKVEAL